MTNRFAVLLAMALLSTACPGPAPRPPECGPATCTGCCTPDGQCAAGNSIAACGFNGTMCMSCVGVGACVPGGRCEAVRAGGAAGGGSAGGGGGGRAGGSGGGVAGGAGGGLAGGQAGGAAGGLIAGGAGGGDAGGASGGGTAGGVLGGGDAGGTAGGLVAGGSAGGSTGTAMGDRCTAPIDIVLANGVGAGLGDRSGSADDATGSCGGSGTGDIVFRFTTPSVGTLVVDVRSGSTQQRLSAFLRTSCDSGPTEVPGSCASASAAGGGVLLVQRGLTAGTYFLWVDGQAAAGPVSVSLTFSPEAGDTCATPIPLPFTNNEVSVVGTTAGATADTVGFCGGTGTDVVYRFDVTTLATLDVTLTPRNPNLQPVVYLRSGTCLTGSQLACNQALSAGTAATLRAPSLTAGTYFLFVDSATANSGEYVLNARLVPPLPGDTCTAPRMLAFSNGTMGGTASDTGDTSLATADSTGTCASGLGGDIVYSFTTATTLDLRATLTTTSASYRPALYLRSSTCTGSERTCTAALTAGTSATLAAGALPAGTYFLWVDGAVGTSGAYSLSASLTAPVTGDSCTSPAALTFVGTDGGVATATGDTSMLFHETSGSCASGTAGDAVYSFTTTSVQDFRAQVATTTAGYRPVLYLRSSFCTGSERTCASASIPGGSASLFVGSLPVGTYFLFVDGIGTTQGAYTLSASLAPPPPGDSCTTAIPLSFSGTDGGVATATADTSNFFNDSSGSCNFGTSGDVVYTFTLSGTQDFRATVTPISPGFQPALYLRNTFCTGSERSCVVAPGVGAAATLSAGGLPAGTYFLWVDGSGASSGTFVLNATVSNPVPGDSCALPRTLVFGADGGTVVETGDTSTLFHESTGNCTSGTAPDAVYSFTTTSTLDLRATATTTTSGFRPALYLRSSFCTGTERGCSIATAPGGTASLNIGGLTPGTYFLWMDGALSTSGQYTLTTSLTPQVQGDVCADPRPLLFSGTDGGVAMDVGDTSTLFHETNGFCTFGTGGDAVYSFTTTQPLDFRATASTTSATFQPALYLRNSCFASDRVCTAAVAGGSSTISSSSLPVGTWFLFVDGSSNTSGPYALTASLGTPLAGDTCLTAKPLVFTNGAAADTGDTTLAFDDNFPACAASAGNDLVYTFTTTSMLDFTARATTTSPTFRPVLSLRNAACTGTERTCNAATLGGGQADLAVQGLPAGTYFLWVEGAGGTTGPFSLTSTLGPAPADEVRPLPIANVTAPGPMVVTFRVLDRFGNLIANDNTTSFTVNVTGTATFTGATTGSIVSGTGTSSVLVQVSGGQVVLTVSASTPQTVTFSAIDSQMNGLRYPGSSVSLTAPAVRMPCDTAVATVVNFSAGLSPNGPGTVRIAARGDLDLTSEYLELFMESVSGTNLGRVFDTGAPSQCGTVDEVATVTVPQATLQSAVVDGTVSVAVRPSTAVNCFCTAGQDDMTLTLTYPTSLTGTFQ